MKRARFINCFVLGSILAIAVVAMTGENALSQVANQPGSVAANSQVAPNDLRAPVRETPEKLVAAIQNGALWQRLTHFQTIADHHPGAVASTLRIRDCSTSPRMKSAVTVTGPVSSTAATTGT